MNKKILIAGFACFSMIAVAQSSGNKDQSASTTKDVKPRDVATGQASGKTVNKPAGSPAVLNSSDQVTAPRDMATGQASGKRQYQPMIIRKVLDLFSVCTPPRCTVSGRDGRARLTRFCT